MPSSTFRRGLHPRSEARAQSAGLRQQMGLVGLPGFSVASINVGRLYLQRDETGFLHANRSLRQVDLRFNSLDHTSKSLLRDAAQSRTAAGLGTRMDL